MGEIQTTPAVQVRPLAEWVQADIERTFELRRDYYKYSIAVATGLLAFTISFPPSLSKLEYPYLIFVAWPSLGIAILCGIAVHYVWAWFFISFRNFDSRGQRAEGKAHRRTLTLLRKALELLQVLTMVVGVLGAALFASANVGNISLKSTDKTAPVTVAPPRP
ncbi:MAG: hypothetical protein ISP49_17345 [Reyranella sp.]|jgi:hypothetical protein|nr:hypothetical protein [Reyranella sp.]